MKTCQANNCSYPVFSHGYCLRHQYKRQDKKYKDAYKRRFSAPQRTSKQRSPSKGYNIPKTSKKRSEQQKEYRQLCKEIDKEAKANKEYNCFFCGEPIKDIADHHHLDGKENERLTDKSKLVLAHRKCHNEYHDKPVDKIKWYNGFLERLKAKNIELYNKELKKKDKHYGRTL